MLLIIVFVYSSCALGAFRQSPVSPESVSAGRTVAASYGSVTATSSNPAMLRFAGRLTVAFGGQRLYSLSELDTYSIQLGIAFKYLSAGVGFNSFGETDLYAENRFYSVLAADITGRLKTGVSITYNQIEFPYSSNNLNAVSFTFGGAYTAHDKIILHTAIANPFEPEIMSGSVVHCEFITGIIMFPIEKMNFGVEVFSRSGEDMRYRIGESYGISREFRLNAGLMTAPFVPSFGFDIKTHWFRIGYAYTYHSDLGSTHTWGLTCNID